MLKGGAKQDGDKIWFLVNHAKVPGVVFTNLAIIKDLEIKL
jgi:hypothetical protein